MAFLLEGVQYIDGIGNFGCIDDAVCAAFFPQADLHHSAADGVHGFEIDRHSAALDTVKLITCRLFGVFGELPQAIQ